MGSQMVGGRGPSSRSRSAGTLRRGGWLAGFALAGLLLSAAPASATFHLMRVREVYPAAGASYVELQMLAAGEDLVGGHHLVSYNANGTVADDFTLPSHVNLSSPINATVLITGPGYAAAFPSGPTTDELDANLNLPASGGAVCWTEGSPPDCVAWGNFTGPLPAHVPPLVVGTPASPTGVTSGKALRRTIAPSCPTLLEEADDSDDSATDFSEQTPNPRNNASPIPEATCPIPEVTIDSKPATPTKTTSAEFTYHSTPAGATFECRLDAETFAACEASGKSYPGPLAQGSHTFRVRATNTSGTGTPAAYTWTVDTTAPTATVKTHPADPSPGGSAAFTYESNEINSTFECSLAKEAEADSFSSCPPTGKTYTSLANGHYTFKVRATDVAENQGSAASYQWEVDNSLADTTPPQTTIESKPPDPSGSSTATFTYSSNEPGSTFECALDGSGFVGCPATGIAYGGLVEGAHTFQVRAIDPSSNVDPTPAGYSFGVALAPPVVTPPPTSKPRINWRKRCRRLKTNKARKRCLRRHHVR
jgi:hypothetical protein